MKTKILVLTIASAISTAALAVNEYQAYPAPTQLVGHADATSFSSVDTFSDSNIAGGNGYVSNSTGNSAWNESGAGSFGQVTKGQEVSTRDIDTNLVDQYLVFQAPAHGLGVVVTAGSVKTEKDVEGRDITNTSGVAGDTWSYSQGGTATLSKQTIYGTGNLFGQTDGSADQDGHGDASFYGTYSVAAPTLPSAPIAPHNEIR